MTQLTQDEGSPPVLPAVMNETGTQAVVWCRYCDRHHYHAPEPGHVVEHCQTVDSPYRETGYVLDMVPRTPESLRPPRSGRRRPQRRWDHQLVHGWEEER